MIPLQRVLVRAVALGAILTMPSMIMPDAHIPHSRYEFDSRAEALSEFLRQKDSPITHLAEEFLIVADKHGLDWRLLPSIAFLESSAGKVYKNNNIFGWNNAETSFSSVREGIRYVGSRLGTSEIYKGKSFEEKLALYNSYAHYAPAVIRVADTLSRMEKDAHTRTRRHIRLLPESANVR